MPAHFSLQGQTAARHRPGRVKAALLLAAAAACCPCMLVGLLRGQSITAPPAQLIKHNGADAAQAFPEVVWQLTSGLDSAGYTSQWTCGPFKHSTKATLKADARLQIRVLSSDGSANWTAVLASDQTDFAAGDEIATVTAQSAATGDAQIGLVATFADQDFSQLGAGDYTITVTGTITAN